MRAEFDLFAQRMRQAGLPEIVIKTFGHYYRQLAEGRTGLIPEAGLEPIGSLPDLDTFPAELAEVGRATLPRMVIIKLNGGLGTSMGLDRAKSLLMVKNGLTFLDIIARQALEAGAPLVLMNSYSTREDSLSLLARYPRLWGPVPLDFVQHRVPKVRQADLLPAEWPADPSLEWCPPGHGDLYTALVTTGMLGLLLAEGYEYAFVSNADNLGAVVDSILLGYMVENGLPFLMEAADRTPADRKGGHLARLAGSGQLILRESAQCPPEDQAAFQDIRRHRYFNTNNLWLHLPSLREMLEAREYILGLPMIRNSKTVDPRDPGSPPVYQLETAMGSAISLFEGAGAVHVPRSRFAPVKTTDDLLAVRSDAYMLTGDFQIRSHPARLGKPVVVRLDPCYYRLVDDLEARFPYGPPSLLACEQFSVKGDVIFGRNVVCRGRVEIVNEAQQPLWIADGTPIE